ncbi:MAG: class I SAM-dependent methyltransferase [Motiliproteus sp.]
MWVDKSEKNILNLTSYQQNWLAKLLNDIESGKMTLIKNYCLCNNDKSTNDFVLSQCDRFGVRVKTVLCSKCGLVRSDLVFDEDSNILFYEKYYRNIYVGSDLAADYFFSEQVKRGGGLFDLYKNVCGVEKKQSVLELGCGAGGILYPFFKYGCNCVGYDFNKSYLEFGIKKGMLLKYGDGLLEEKSSFDLIVLSHVFEHFLDPVETIVSISSLLKPGGNMVIEVPGVYNIDAAYNNPYHYFQSAHVYSFSESYLKVIFTSIGFEILYSDEICVFIIKKLGCHLSIPENIVFDSSSERNSKLLYRYFNILFLKHELFISKGRWRLFKSFLKKRLVLLGVKY